MSSWAPTWCSRTLVISILIVIRALPTSAIIPSLQATSRAMKCSTALLRPTVFTSMSLIGILFLIALCLLTICSDNLCLQSNMHCSAYYEFNILLLGY
ncbi:unnamed protein product [Rodentolepis nana]|uniref:Secreted protein n=1 Tax=Rodentolepis nana TaxID=102285 RepID=A0A0R3TG07_RODNA|nr:unnamed protein product [Rodentolepis nana]